MNICILISSLNYGGSSQVVTDLACALKDKGNTVTVVTLWNSNDYKYIKVLNSKGIDVKTCNKKGKYDFFCYRRLRTLLRDGNFDLINTHLTSLFYCFLAKPNQKIVHTVHSVPELDIPKTYRFLMKRWIRRHKVRFVGCSRDIAERSMDCYKNCKVELITNGYNIATQLNEIEISKEFDFIYVGRLVSMKNVDEIIKSFYNINKKNDMHLCVVGDGPEKNKLEEFCCDSKISNVYFTGSVDDVFEYLKKSKVFCLFSDFEGGPICLLEAMSCGLPVVCSNIGGNLTYVKDGINGLTFELHNTLEASEKMRTLLEDKVLYDKMSKEALKTAEENSIENMTGKYELLFKRLMNEQY